MGYWKWLGWLVLAVTARADTGYVYAAVVGSSPPSIFAPKSLNPYGPISATRNSTGSYAVTFSNSGIGTGWNALANAASAAPGDYCNVYTWSASAVNVKCYGPGGVAADSDFMVLAVSTANDKGIYFALDSNFSPFSFTPSSNFSYNPSGTIAINHPLTGLYKVAFNGLGATGGTVEVDAYSSNYACNTAGWTGSGAVNVQCYDPSGNAGDTDFVILIVPPGGTPTGLGYTYEDVPFYTANYTPSGPTYNSTGNAVSIQRQAMGQFRVLFNGMSSVPFAGGFMMATADGTSARCTAFGWGNLGSSGAFEADIYCTDPVGNYTDSDFEVLVLPPMGYAYAQTVDNSGTVAQSNSLNPGGAAITTAHLSTGNYTVTFPNSGIGPGWVVQAISLSTNWCNIGNWGGSGASVRCYTPTGALADSKFEVLAISNTNEESIAFAWAGSPSTASYTPDVNYSYNPAGTIAITRTATGSYQVVFQGLTAGGGTMQVGAYGSAATTCTSAGWVGPNFQANVACYDSSGNPADSAFAITVISNGSTPPNLAWAWANAPTTANYTAPPADVYDASGAVTIGRSAVGTYAVDFPGFSSNGQAFLQVTPYNAIARCSTPQAAVKCYSMAGAAKDAEYTAMTLGNIAGMPGQMFVSAGGTQSAVIGTAFSTALAVTVLDGKGNPLVGAYVTFTAPPLGGVTGYFFDPLYAGVLTVTVATDSNGIATAPQFTAIEGTGTFFVTANIASFPGGAAPVGFTLTTLPLTPVTLQTSPAGLNVSLAGSAFAAAPVTASLPGGTSQTIAAQSPQFGSGTRYIFLNWSDQGAISHNITVPTSAATYTANFKTQYYLDIFIPSPVKGTATGGNTFYDVNTNAAITATPAAGYRFASWTGGTVANQTSASTTVAMTGEVSLTPNFALSCAVTGAANAGVGDVQAMINEALGKSAPQFDLNADGVVNATDVLMVARAAMGGACLSQ